jgi:hypothetical protein
MNGLGWQTDFSVASSSEPEGNRASLCCLPPGIPQVVSACASDSMLSEARAKVMLNVPLIWSLRT